MTTIDRKPSGTPCLLEVAAMLAMEGDGTSARAIRDAHDRLKRLRELLVGDTDVLDLPDDEQELREILSLLTNFEENT